jgi:hypothetical protein
MSSTGTSYALDGDSRDLAKYVGKKVEITGRIESSSTSSSSTSTSNPPSATSSMSSIQHVRVSDVKEIGACSR